MEKLDGVEAARVSLNEGLVVIDLKPRNTVTLADIRDRVQRNGFTPQGATVTVRARVAAAGDSLRLEVMETKETFDVATTPHAGTSIGIEQHVGQVVIIEGLIAALKEKEAAVIQVTRVDRDGADPSGAR